MNKMEQLKYRYFRMIIIPFTNINRYIVKVHHFSALEHCSNNFYRQNLSMDPKTSERKFKRKKEYFSTNTFINLKVKHSNFTVEKIYRHQFTQMIKVNITEKKIHLFFMNVVLKIPICGILDEIYDLNISMRKYLDRTN